MRLQPVLKKYIWGVEDWILSAHPDGDNIIIDGDYGGLTLSQAVKINPGIVSKNFEHEKNFPLLIKIINAAAPLSVQVHPNKTEFWYIIDCEPGAFLYLGFKDNITRNEFERSISDNSLPELLNKIEVRKGDTFFIPSGVVHSINAGIKLAEIQENSNITYRIYDYGRGRELHIKQALDVVKLSPPSSKIPGADGDFLVRCGKFSVKKIFANKGVVCESQDKFAFALSLSGGYNIFIPACSRDFYIDDGEFLLCTV